MGKLFVLSGASGVGKGSVLHRAMEQRQDLKFSISATTRPPRPSEVHGVHYYFVSQDEFARMVAQEEFLEYDCHAAAYYGTPLQPLEEMLTKYHVILDIEPKGAEIVRQKRPDATLIFLMPPSIAELEHRLRNRGDTSEEQIALRLQRAQWEMEQACWYDQFEQCVSDLLAIIAEQADTMEEE